MKRRNFLKSALIGSGAAFLPAVSFAEKKINSPRRPIVINAPDPRWESYYSVVGQNQWGTWIEEHFQETSKTTFTQVYKIAHHNPGSGFAEAWEKAKRSHIQMVDYELGFSINL